MELSPATTTGNCCRGSGEALWKLKGEEECIKKKLDESSRRRSHRGSAGAGTLRRLSNSTVLKDLDTYLGHSPPASATSLIRGWLRCCTGCGRSTRGSRVLAKKAARPALKAGARCSLSVKMRLEKAALPPGPARSLSRAEYSASVGKQACARRSKAMLAAPSACPLSLWDREDTTLPEGELPPDTREPALLPVGDGGRELIGPPPQPSDSTNFGTGTGTGTRRPPQWGAHFRASVRPPTTHGWTLEPTHLAAR